MKTAKKLILWLAVICLILSLLNAVNAKHAEDQAVCGNSIVEDDEVCDTLPQACTTDYGYFGEQSCKSRCNGWNACDSSEECGDGIINGYEQCDDGNKNSHDGCSSSCLVETTFYKDKDNDGYGDAAHSKTQVDAPKDYVADNTDCDDDDSAINPGAMEFCNGMDDNCNAETDEGYDIGVFCFSDSNSCGDADAGEYVCSEDGLSSECSVVQPFERFDWNQECISESNECGDTSDGVTDCDGICSAETPFAIDSDSDGTADCNDECESDPFKAEAGICGCGVSETDTDADGIPDCIDDDANCDGIDNDGNGIADDGYVPSETFCGTGACASTGFMQCVDGMEIDSCTAGEPSEETCNNIDDNCNGQADEENGFEPLGFYSFSVFGSLTQSCYTGPENTLGIGECASGLQTCSEGDWDACANEVLPAEEICDGLDNDCDGETDEGNFTDSDNDGIKDCVDDDSDNDGVADSEDSINGASSDINTNVQGGLLFSVDDVQDAASHAGKGKVRIKDSAGNVLVEFDYDFATAFDLSSINITSGNDGFGSMIIRGINLTGQNITKTAYIERTAASDTLCIVDDEVDSIVAEGDCSNGIKLSCPGTNGDYSCELTDNNTKYKVSGLKHSAVKEYSYSAPSVSAAAPYVGGSSGNLIVVPHNAAKPAKEAPAEEVQEEVVIEEQEEAPVAEEAPSEEPTSSNSRSGLGQITGRVVDSVRNSPGAWGGSAGFLLALLLITTIYSAIRNTSKNKFPKN